MDICDLNSIRPYVRMVKIKKAIHLDGSWEDFDHVFIYNAQGCLDWLIAGNRYHLEEGSFILIPPYLHHLAIKENQEELVQYILHFDFYEDAERMQIPHQSALCLEQKPPLSAKEQVLRKAVYTAAVPVEERFRLEKLFLNMYQEFSQKEEGWQAMLCGLCLQLQVLISRYLSAGTMPRHSGAEKKSWKIVEKALDYIYLHYDEPIENVVISEAIGESPNYLSKLFQQYVGVSLHAYVQNYRLEKAQQMLSSGKYNITETALKCGFSSIHTFSKIFKKARGISPSAYLELSGRNAPTVAGEDYSLKKYIFYNQ